MLGNFFFLLNAIEKKCFFQVFFLSVLKFGVTTSLTLYVCIRFDEIYQGSFIPADFLFTCFFPHKSTKKKSNKSYLMRENQRVH